MALVRHITLQHKIDAFLSRKFKEHPKLEEDPELLLASHILSNSRPPR